MILVISLLYGLFEGLVSNFGIGINSSPNGLFCIEFKSFMFIWLFSFDSEVR